MTKSELRRNGLCVDCGRTSEGKCRCPKCSALQNIRTRRYSASHPRKRRRKKEYTDRWKEQNHERHLMHKRRSQAKHRGKQLARMAVRNAVKAGRLIRPAICSRCLLPGLIHGHHENYEKPLEVIWLCHKCHEDVHHRRPEE